MEQFEVVFKPVKGYEHVAIKGENGELIIRLVPDSHVASQDSAICSQSEATEKITDKATHFTKISAEDREKVKKWLTKQRGKTERERNFLAVVKEAVQKINYDYWIATIEPSVVNGKIFYAKGEKVGVGFSSNQWNQMGREYAPERGSRQSNLKELLMWYALRIANGLWTLDYVANDSSSAGNYWNAPNSAKSMERTGERECGGYNDGQGNTYKIVTVEDGFALVGGFYVYDGSNYPVADVGYCNGPDGIHFYSSGVLVLTK